MIDASISGDIVTVLLDAGGVAKFQLTDRSIDQIWLAWDALLWTLAHQHIAQSRTANRTTKTRNRPG